MTFTISPAPATLAPPTPIAPLGAVPASSDYDLPTFSWSSVSGANHYYLYVIDNTTGQVVINNPNVGNGATFTATLVKNHSYTWYLAAVSTNGTDIAIGGPDSFTLT